MAKIKCRYYSEYCTDLNQFRHGLYEKKCNPMLCASRTCEDAVYNEWNEVTCDHVRYADAEFEVNARQYEIDLGEKNPTLRIGRRQSDEIQNIIYLEIDGRVLIYNRRAMVDSEVEKEES